MLDGGQAVRNDESRAIADQLLQGCLDMPLRLRIQRRGGLVENQNRCILQQRARDRDPLALPPRQQHAPVAHHGVEPKGQIANELHGVRSFRCTLHLCIRDLTSKSDVVAYRVIKQHDFLADHGYLLTQVVELIVAHVVSIDADESALCLVEPGNETDESGLAAA